MAEIFDIKHESDLSEYTSTVTDGGDLSQSVAAALAGTAGGMQCVIDDTNSIYGRKDFTQLTSTVYRWRFYFDPNGLTMSSGNTFGLCIISDTGTGRGRIQFSKQGANYRVDVAARDDGGSWNTSSKKNISDAEHYIEARIRYASSAVANDGDVTLWVDGTQAAQVTGLDIFDVSKPDQARLGAVSGVDTGTSGTYYLDEFVLRDDDIEIGAVIPGQPVAIRTFGVPTGIGSRNRPGSWN